jgi:hypothetical protein
VSVEEERGDVDRVETRKEEGGESGCVLVCSFGLLLRSGLRFVLGGVGEGMVGGELGLDRGTGGRSEWLLLVSYLLDFFAGSLWRNSWKRERDIKENLSKWVERENVKFGTA